MTLQLRNPNISSKIGKHSGHENASINTTVTGLSVDSKSELQSPSSSNGSSASLNSMSNGILKYYILQVFPFTSESKRMGIIIKDVKTGEITFYLKGADIVMANIVQYNDWLNEESDTIPSKAYGILHISILHSI